MGFIIAVVVGGFAVLSTLLCIALCRAAGELDEMEERAWRERLREKDEPDGR